MYFPLKQDIWERKDIVLLVRIWMDNENKTWRWTQNDLQEPDGYFYLTPSLQT